LSAANKDEFFSSAYRDLSGSAGTGTPMFHQVTGTIVVAGGELTMTSARIGNTTPAVDTKADDASNTAVFNLSQNYQVSFKVVAIAGVTTKKFQIYVDNITSSSDNSIHGGSLKLYSKNLDSLAIGDTVIADGFVATSTSFIPKPLEDAVSELS